MTDSAHTPYFKHKTYSIAFTMRTDERFDRLFLLYRVCYILRLYYELRTGVFNRADAGTADRTE